MKHLINRSEKVELGSEEHLLRVFVELGARWVDKSDSGENSSVQAYVEANFVAEYKMKNDLGQECIDEFALRNVSYHIWPYWRELLMSQCVRMHLPKLVLPALQLAHNRHMPSREKQ